MNENSSPDRLVRQAKQKFAIFSILGVSIVFILSYVAFQYHRSVIQHQKAIQSLYSNLSKQLTLMHEIAVLGEKFGSQINSESEPYLEAEFKRLIEKLNIENKSLRRWLQQTDSSAFRDIEGLLNHENLEYRILSYIKRAKELADRKDMTWSEIRSNIKYLTTASHVGLADVFEHIRSKVEQQNTNALALLDRIGLILIVICLLEVILTWFFVFRPLYATIVHQNEHLAESVTQANAASRSKTEFLANISHEIRTPMTAILGYVELLKNRANDQDKDDALSIIDRNASHLLSLINEILDVSRIEAGKLILENKPTQLQRLISETYALVGVKADEKGLALRFREVGPLPTFVSTDAQRLKQVLCNVIGNAVKFTSHGSVQVDIWYEKDPLNLLTFRVEDTGPGIPSDKTDKIFRPFEQVDSTITRQYGGTGLGLALSRSLAQKMGGNIKLEKTKVGQGTVFRVTVQAQMVNESLMQTVERDNLLDANSLKFFATMLAGRRLLVVDDIEENVRLFAIYLQRYGAQVDTAIRGDRAVELAKQNSYDMILLDLQMPGKDGYQTLSDLRRNRYHNPVAALTAHAMEEQRNKTRSAGFDTHITKPIGAKELVRAVYQALEVFENQAPETVAYERQLS